MFRGPVRRPRPSPSVLLTGSWSHLLSGLNLMLLTWQVSSLEGYVARGYLSLPVEPLEPRRSMHSGSPGADRQGYRGTGARLRSSRTAAPRHLHVVQRRLANSSSLRAAKLFFTAIPRLFIGDRELNFGDTWPVPGLIDPSSRPLLAIATVHAGQTQRGRLHKYHTAVDTGIAGCGGEPLGRSFSSPRPTGRARIGSAARYRRRSSARADADAYRFPAPSPGTSDRSSPGRAAPRHSDAAAAPARR